jgi:hypothetical protein
MTVVDGQLVFRRVFAEETPAALSAAELRRLRNMVNAFAPGSAINEGL